MLLFMMSFDTYAESAATRPVIYLIPGHGSDYRIFSKWTLDGFETRHVELITPERRELMPDYSRRLAEQIDTSVPFILIGVSFGGMNSVEMCKFLSPERIIIISSAKTWDELPFRYRILRLLRLDKIFPARCYIALARVGRRLFESDYLREKSVFKQMLQDKDPRFVKRAMHGATRWRNTVYPDSVVHIHGTKDHTIPIRNIENVIAVEGGSHMMTLTEADRVSGIVNEILDEYR